MIELVQEYNKYTKGLPSKISNSYYKPEFFMKLLELKSSTYYRKLRENAFTSEEVELITMALYQDDTIVGLVKKSEKDYKEGKTYTHKEAMKYLRERHL